jgi:hypothetical protein
MTASRRGGIRQRAVGIEKLDMMRRLRLDHDSVSVRDDR